MRKTKINASYISYLLNIFDGKLTYTDITSMPLSRLSQLQKIKEEELEERSRQIKKQSNASKKEEQMTVSNSKKRFKDKSYR